MRARLDGGSAAPHPRPVPATGPVPAAGPRLRDLVNLPILSTGCQFGRLDIYLMFNVTVDVFARRFGSLNRSRPDETAGRRAGARR